MSFGNSRQPSPFTVGGMADENLAQQLALYKSPATIRDMKQTYFYISAAADLININPLIYRYGIQDPNGAAITKSLYYGNLGTTRAFNIVDKVNELMDIRVPKDKYVVEINLVECGIEADPSNWTSIPDKVARKVSTLADGEETYTIEDTYVDSVNRTVVIGPPNPPRDVIVDKLVQATKVTAPQTLYCRIKELNNGEPYNWSVTNSGAYSIDKMHQLLVRHGDVNYANLTLEFGHMVFNGYDEDEQSVMLSNRSAQYIEGKIDALGKPRINFNKNTYRQYKYLDYNSETFNVVAKDPNPVLRGNYYPSTDYPSFYKGEGGLKVNPTTGISVPVNTGTNLIQPVNRPPFLTMDGSNSGLPPPPAAPVDPWNYQGKPLLFNQQVSKLGFRFLVRIIHMF